MDLSKLAMPGAAGAEEADMDLLAGEEGIPEEASPLADVSDEDLIAEVKSRQIEDMLAADEAAPEDEIDMGLPMDESEV